jgi:hypothetical protein
MIEDANGRQWILAAEAAEHLGRDVTPHMVRAWAARRDVTQVRIREGVFYALDELREAEKATRRHADGGRKRPEV